MHKARVDGELLVGQDALATIDGERREAIRRNHTATHLLHSALRTVLGDHVRQQGSLVSPDYLRFDFSHHGQPTPEELDEVFSLANDAVLTDVGVETVEATRDEAEKMGAIAFFGDKYGYAVRVVRAGTTSLEFCGGTHVDSLGQIGPITLLSEGSIGSNTRRIFAVTGKVAIERAKERETAAYAPPRSWCAPSPTSCWPPSAARSSASARPRSELSSLRQQSSEAEAGTLAAAAAADGGVVVARRDNVDGKALQNLAQAVLRHEGVRAVVLAGSPDGAKVAIAAATGGDPTPPNWSRRWASWLVAGEAVRPRWHWPAARTRRRSRPRWLRHSDSSPRERGAGPGRRRTGGAGGGLDLGARRIGVAYSDSGRTLASPWGTIERSGDAARDREAVVAAVRECEAGTLVVGLPLSLSGQAGPAALAALEETEALRRCCATRRDRGDGRRTLHHGRGRARHAAAGRTGKAARKVVDSAAAMVLLPVLAGPHVSGPSEGDEAGRPPRVASPAEAISAPSPPEAPAEDRAVRLRRAGRAQGPRRSARVRRRRRIVAAVGGTLLVLVLAFVLWYELESHALGPAGHQVVVTVHEDEGSDSVVDCPEPSPRDRQLAGLPHFERLPRRAEPGPRQLRPPPEPEFSEVRAILAAGPNIFPVDVRPGFTLAEVASEVDAIPGHAQGGFANAANSGAVHSVSRPPVPTTSRACWARGTTWCSPGKATSHCTTRW